MKLNILLVIATLIMTISGGAVNAQDAANDSVFDLLKSNPDFTILTSAIERAELDEELSNPDASYTIFAPTDEAFVELLADLELETDVFLNDSALTMTLMYHVLPMAFETSDIDAELAEHAAFFTDTLYEAPVHITRDEDSIFVNGNPLASADTMANNGVVHALDGVLSPPQTLWNIVETSANPDEESGEAPQFTILAEAIDIADLEADLAVEDADFTLFAPTDEAFIAAAESLDLAPADLLADRDFVTSILLSHVVRGELTSVDLIDLSVESGAPISLENLNEQSDELQVLIDDEGLSVEGARIIEADMLARNGVIHVIDHVLIPNDS